MANDFFTAASVPSTGASLTSATIRNEFAAIEDGFDKLPTMTGNGSKIVAVNSGGTALEAITTASGIATFLGSPSSANLRAAVTDETGSGSLVFASSPTLVTPVLGVATATSINKMAITAPATSSTLAVADGKTFTASNTLTLAGTDGTTLNINAVATLNSGAYTPTASAESNCSSTTPRQARWLRIGDTVHVTGEVDTTASSGAVFTFELSLPVASNFADAHDCSGGGGTDNISTAINIQGSAANNTAVVTCPNSVTGAHTLQFVFSYDVI